MANLNSIIAPYASPSHVTWYIIDDNPSNPDGLIAIPLTDPKGNTLSLTTDYASYVAVIDNCAWYFDDLFATPIPGVLGSNVKPEALPMPVPELIFMFVYDCR